MIWPIDWQNPGDQQTVTTLLVSLPEMPVIFRALDIAYQADRQTVHWHTLALAC